MFGKHKIATLVAEFLGTGILTILVLSVQRSTIGVPFFIATAAGLTVALMVFVFGSTSGAHLNPAITVGLWTARRISTLHAVAYIALQFLGAWAAYGVYSYFVKQSIQPIGGHFAWRIFTAESVGTAVFAFGWASALYQRFSTPVTASVTGLSYMLGIIAASSASVGLLNPAVALGVRSWVVGSYVAGPLVGALIGINLFKYLFAVPVGEVAAASAVSTAPVPVARARTTRLNSSLVAKTRATTKKPKAKKTTTRKKSTRRK